MAPEMIETIQSKLNVRGCPLKKEGARAASDQGEPIIATHKKFIGVALAAGMGSRLKPLTNDKPKPLVPFMGVELLYLALKKIQATNILDLGVNSYYLPEKIEGFIDSFIEEECSKSTPSSANIFISREKQKILGTAGCYASFGEFRRDRSILAINGDIFTNTCLAQLIKSHESSPGCAATLSVLKTPHTKGLHIWVENQKIVHIGETCEGFIHATPHGFSGIQILSDKILRLLPQGSYEELVPFYKKLIDQGFHLQAYINDPVWYDVGTLKDYYEAHQYVLGQLNEQDHSLAKDIFGIYSALKAKKLSFTFIPSNTIRTLKSGITAKGPSFIVGEPEMKALNNDQTISGEENGRPLVSDPSFVSIGPGCVIMNNVAFEPGVAIERCIVLPGSKVAYSATNKIIDGAHVIDV